MPRKVPSLPLLALLLALVFLGAQFHFCADVTAAPSGSHLCPLCSTTTVFLAAPSPTLAVVPLANRLELPPLLVPAPVALLRSPSPRAPPAAR